MSDNRNKNDKVDESILDETPPNINEPQTPKEQIPTEDSEEGITEEITDEQNTEVETETTEETQTTPRPPSETDVQKEQRYKAQQSEAQIQAAKNKALIERVEQSSNLAEPTIDDLKAFVAQDGVDWEELTVFEQATARRSYKSEKSLALIREATEVTKRIDEWAKQVDTFIDETDSKPEFVKLSGHEHDFRKFAMQDAHRGTPIDVLLSSFLFNLPEPVKVRSSLFPRGGGGAKPEESGKLTDTDSIANLRTTNPREYKRLIKAGKISPEV